MMCFPCQHVHTYTHVLSPSPRFSVISPKDNWSIGVLSQAAKINDGEMEALKKIHFHFRKSDRREWSLGQICLGTEMTIADTTRKRRLHISSILWIATGSGLKRRALLCGKREAHIKVKCMQVPPIRMQNELGRFPCGSLKQQCVTRGRAFMGPSIKEGFESDQSGGLNVPEQNPQSNVL